MNENRPPEEDGPRNNYPPQIVSEDADAAQERIRLLQDVAARVVFIEEALQDGDSGMAFTIARDLELDLRSAIADYEVAA